MSFSEQQTKALSGKLSGSVVHTRERHGVQLSYIEGWHAIAEANRIFGFDGWDRETIAAECVWKDERRAPKACAYAVRVRIRVRAGETIISRDGSGVGQGTGETMGEAHESALKEAETDATKRALTTFGNLFGLALYDKQQNGVRRNARRANTLWSLMSATGDVTGRYESAKAFCTALRETMCIATTINQLEALWQQNREGVERVQTQCPDLKSPQGTHYAELPGQIYHRSSKRLAPAPASPRDYGATDKSELVLGEPKRLRNEAHRQFVASQPCIVCDRTPSHAHHLKFAQARAMARKVSDEWVVPLCFLHHRALHEAGNEERWWDEQRIDARTEAEKLWRVTRGTSSEIAPVTNNSAGPVDEGSAGETLRIGQPFAGSPDDSPDAETSADDCDRDRLS
jgi:DNA recombination protein Rad52